MDEEYTEDDGFYFVTTTTTTTTTAAPTVYFETESSYSQTVDQEQAYTINFSVKNITQDFILYHIEKSEDSGTTWSDISPSLAAYLKKPDGSNTYAGSVIHSIQVDYNGFYYPNRQTSYTLMYRVVLDSPVNSTSDDYVVTVNRRTL